MPKTIIILGPPGTGKTSSAITVTQGWFERGASPLEVAYLAFTRAAAREAASRIMGDVPPEDWGEKLPYFRTIHSLAYKGLKSSRRDLRVISTADMKAFAQWSSFEGTYTVSHGEDLSDIYQALENRGRTEWDDCLNIYTLARIIARTPEDLEAAKIRMPDVAIRNSGLISEDLYQVFVKQYEQYKMANGLVDFTDMLKFALCDMKPLEEVRYLVVDELQDNAPILFSICDRLFPNAEAWLCGDPNQSIYRFSGADPRLFLEKARNADHRIILRRTHRFGQEIVDFSKKIIARASDGVLVDLKGVSGRRHRIRMAGYFEPTVSDMLILHRHVLGCQALAQAYIMAGLPFRNERGQDPLGAEKRVESFLALHELANGQEVGSKEITRLIEDVIPSILASEPGARYSGRLVVHGAKKQLQEGYVKESMTLQELIKIRILTELAGDIIRNRYFQGFKHADDLAYYGRVLDNGYDLGGKAIPRITTIHGSKGRQAPSVVVFNEMGARCFEDNDGEHRLAYVAATRTQGDLDICTERTLDWAHVSYDYPVPKEATSGGG